MANPFKDIKELTRDVESYLRKNRSAIYNNCKRISDFFEMACYNNIVRFYENRGYEISVKNPQKNKFNYKCTTAGNPAKYSYFEAKRKIGRIEFIFEIRHNINVQSYHNSDTYTTPDILIIKPNSIKEDDDFYDSKLKYYYIENKSLISFCEVKNFNPFPELLFNFIGVVNELKPNLMRKVINNGNSHIATTLMISGKSNKHADRIITNLQSRYHINVLCDLFNIGGITFGRRAINRVKTV
ncbi:MAG: hypothetical protein PHP53_20770 [Prolixibacteraceae bacterium]|nr:hypothetical protein [Prolixibacteraceae bacterium]